MDTRIYHGNFKASEITKALVARFNSGNLIAQAQKSGDQHIVQIASRHLRSSGGQTELGVIIQEIEEGVTISVGKQSILGIAASLGHTALATLKNPLNILGRLDDVAQDIENLNLDDMVWEKIDEIANTAHASHQLSERLRRLMCEYCWTANPIGEPRCIACGAPLGDVQPTTCHNCGFVIKTNESICPNCGKNLPHT
jgi:lipopolysaccharide biosynthesis regulator YciM